jgi:hypothetical protein
VAKEIRADPTELTKLAVETLDASKRLGDGFRDGYADMALPQAAFGNTAGGPQVYLATRRRSARRSRRSRGR